MMAERKTRYKHRQHVQNLAESLGVTHQDMLKVEDKEDLDFEDDIHENSSYWK